MNDTKPQSPNNVTSVKTQIKILNNNSDELTQSRRQEVIASIDISLNQQHQLKTLLNQIVEVVTAFLPSTGGSSILLWNKETQIFEKSASTVENQDGKEASRRVRKKGGATRWIVNNKKPLIVSNIENDPFTANPILKEASLYAYAGVPLLIKDECIGVLYALSKEKRDYSRTDIHFLENLAIRAAVAIKNITLLEDMLQANEALALEKFGLLDTIEKELVKPSINNELDLLKVEQQTKEHVFTKNEVMLLNNITQHINVISHNYSLAQTVRNSKELIVNSRKEERKRIRRDLHDSLGPTLASTALMLETAQKIIYSNPEQGESILKNLEIKMSQTLTDVRSIVHGLHPNLIDQYGLQEAIKRELKTFESESLTINFDVAGQINHLDNKTEIAIYRIINEAIHNVHKHAKATLCKVTISYSEKTLSLTIQDNGIGLKEKAKGGIGLQSISERVKELRGNVYFEGAIPSGFKLKVIIPISESDSET